MELIKTYWPESLTKKAEQALYMLHPGLFTEQMAGTHGSKAQLRERIVRLKMAEVQGRQSLEFSQEEMGGSISLSFRDKEGRETILSVNSEEVVGEWLSRSDLVSADRALASIEIDVSV